jgi:hypothetical protein
MENIKKKIKNKNIIQSKKSSKYRLLTSVADLDTFVFGLMDLDPDPLVRGTDSDPSIIKQK